MANNNPEMSLEPDKGDTIENFSMIMVNNALVHDCVVTAVFNGVKLLADKYTRQEYLQGYYYGYKCAFGKT